MSTFIERFDDPPRGRSRLAVKDLIDVAASITTAGCRALADLAVPASVDAPLMAGARAADVCIVGKTNLHELAFGISGINPWYGTPVNPLDPGLIPGGSSSGSAVAVATGEADVAYGSDTGGSVRIPSACCGTAGLKTTWGRVSLDGVWPLAPSLDTVGPMARDIAGLVLGMQWLEPGFVVDTSVSSTPRIGRVRLRGIETNPLIDAAIDRALSVAEIEVVDVELGGWAAAGVAGGVVLLAEAWATDRQLLEREPQSIGDAVAERLRLGSAITAEQIEAARAERATWRAELAKVLASVDALALPTLLDFPPRLDEPEPLDRIRCTMPINFAGVPALSMPVPTKSPLPASLQLVGLDQSEATLLTVAARIEAAVAR